MKVPFKINAKLWLPVLGVALGLNACSSGGGGGGFNAPDIPDQPIAIDSSNEDQVAQAAFEGSNGGAGLGSPVTGVIGVQTDSTGNTQGVSPSLFNRVKTLFDNAVDNNLQQNGNVSVSGVQQSGSDSCGYKDPFTNEQIGSGTESFRINVAAGFNSTTGEPNSITAGDSVSVSFNNCDYGDGAVQNGSMSITFNTNISLAALNSDNYDIDISFSFNNLSTNYTDVDPPYTETLHGTISIGLTVIGSSTTFDMSGDSFYAVLPNESIHLTNFSFKATTDGVNNTVEAKFTIASTSIDGQITVASYFEASGSGYPTSGYMNITGDNSQLNVEVNGDGTVNVTLTVNGAVEAGYPKDVAWSDLGIEVNNAF
jgi:hypothetical protein